MSETKEMTVQKKERNITDVVLSRVGDLTQKRELVIPPNYSAENALKSAWLILQEVKDKAGTPALVSCGQSSVANALLDMVIQGLSPSKKQCYFVVYGKQLQLMRSYMGTMAVTKRLVKVKDVHAECIYKGDEFEYEMIPETGAKRITRHIQHLENIDLEKLIGSYAVVVMENPEDSFAEIMTIDQIRKAWNQGAAKGSSGAHKNFTDEMAKKTVINRACKLLANTSDDSDLLIEAFNRSTENEYVVPSENVRVNENALDQDEVAMLDEVARNIFASEPDPFAPVQLKENAEENAEELMDEALVGGDEDATADDR